MVREKYFEEIYIVYASPALSISLASWHPLPDQSSGNVAFEMSSFPPLLPDMLESTVAGFGLERPMVGIHIRRTDKVSSSLNFKPRTNVKIMHFRLAQRLHSILWRNIWSMWRSGSGWLSPFSLTVSQHLSTHITFCLQALWADAYLENPQGLCCIRRSQGWCSADSDAETLLSLAQVLGECRKKYPGIEFIGDQVGICQHDLVSAWSLNSTIVFCFWH